MDDSKTRITLAAIKAVRQYGLEGVRQYGLGGVRIQNVSELAGISSGAIYRHFDGNEHSLTPQLKVVSGKFFKALKE